MRGDLQVGTPLRWLRRVWPQPPRVALTAFVAVALAAVVALAAAHARTNAEAGNERSVAEDARFLAAHTTPFQTAILQDGRVTAAEYAQATRRTASCLRRQAPNVKVGPVTAGAGGELHFDWWLESGDDARARRVFERCHARFRDDVATIHSNQRVVPPAERPAVLRRLVSCLRAAGLSVPGRPTMEMLVAILNADGHELGRQCTEQTFHFLRLRAPIPGA